MNKTAEDYLYHHAETVDTKIKIIKIDDKTMNKMGDFSTWNRDVYAQLVETLSVSDDIRPAVIGFDVLFSSEKDTESDLRFAEACAKYDNVITGFSYVFTKEVTSDKDGNLVVDGMSVQEKVIPYTALREVTGQGFVNAHDGCVFCSSGPRCADVKRNIIQPRQVDLDCRITYLMCDPLWYEVMSCPHCHYTNHYLKFFEINNFEHEVVERILQSIVQRRRYKNTKWPFRLQVCMHSAI